MLDSHAVPLLPADWHGHRIFAPEFTNFCGNTFAARVLHRRSGVLHDVQDGVHHHEGNPAFGGDSQRMGGSS